VMLVVGMGVRMLRHERPEAQQPARAGHAPSAQALRGSAGTTQMTGATVIPRGARFITVETEAASNRSTRAGQPERSSRACDLHRAIRDMAGVHRTDCAGANHPVRAGTIDGPHALEQCRRLGHP
jgi:hypothetical protein